MYELATPKKRSNNYYVKITQDKKPIFLSFFKLNLIQVCPLSNQQGYAYIFKIPTTEYNYKVIQEIEENIVEQIIEKNHKWFKNDLSADTIRNLFKSSIHNQEFLVYYSTMRPPNSTILNFDQWHTDKKYSMPISIRCKVQCDGLFIYPKKFQLRWILTTFNEYDEESHLEEVSIDPEERREIEEYWTEQYQGVVEKITVIKEKQEQILLKCKNVQEELESLFGQIKETESLNEWNLKIEAFKKRLLSWNESVFF